MCRQFLNVEDSQAKCGENLLYSYEGKIGEVFVGKIVSN